MATGMAVMIKERTPLIQYGVISILLALLFYPVLIWLVKSWLNNPYYTHGFLIVPLSALLAWRQWRYVVDEPREGGAWVGLILMVASLAAVVWAMRWQDYVIAALGLVALLSGILLFLEGWARVRFWLFPLAFLALMVPLPFIDLASPWLESFTAKAATAVVQLAGIPAVHQGGEISLPDTTLIVGAPCSGLRSLVTMVTVAVGWVYLVDGRPAAKALMLIAIVPIVILANVLRVAILLVVAVLVSPQVALSYYHDWSSPVLFLMALGLLLVLGKVLGCSRVRGDIF
jgi:exosortase